MLLTFASLRGEVTGRHPTETQSEEGNRERVAEKERERWRHREQGREERCKNQYTVLSFSAAAPYAPLYSENIFKITCIK